MPLADFKITDDYINGVMDTAITFVENKLGLSSQDARIDAISKRSQELADALSKLKESYKKSQDFNTSLEKKDAIGQLSPQQSTEQAEFSAAIKKASDDVFKLMNDYK